MKKLVIIIVCLFIPLLGFSKNGSRKGNDSYLYEIESDLSAIGEKTFNVVTKTLESKGLKPSETELECIIDKYGTYYEVIVSADNYPFQLDDKEALYGFKNINGYFVNFKIYKSAAKGDYFPLKLPIKLSTEKKKILKPNKLNKYIFWRYFITNDGIIKLNTFIFDLTEE